MDDVNNRLRSLASWPVTFIERHKMASAGFYYTYEGDKVECHLCGIVLGDWTLGDDPFEAHERFSPGCGGKTTMEPMEVDFQLEDLPYAAILAKWGFPYVAVGTVGCPVCDFRTRVDGKGWRELVGSHQVKSPRCKTINSWLEFNMTDVENRLRTLEEWPSQAVDRSKLAKCGFFYTPPIKGLLEAGDEQIPVDAVECFACDLLVGDWQPGDDPSLVHTAFDKVACPINDQDDEGYHSMERIEHHDMTLLRNRMSTLATMSRDKQLKLAAAGMYAASGCDNAVRCFACRLVFDELDLKTLEVSHARVAPQCPLVLANDMSHERNRLRTFARWPMESQVSTKRLAEAGFYYTEQRDRVRCYACDIGVDRWRAGDDPRKEHARLSPRCPHVRANNSCGRCTGARATVVLYPCGHLLCIGCAVAKDDCPTCPRCYESVTDQIRLAR